jgi:hypothetical protein
MGRTTRLNTLARRSDPCPGVMHRTNGPPQDEAHLRASDPAAPANRTLVGRDLHNQRMSYASGGPRDVNRRERRGAEQTDDEREWGKALAGEIHGC